MSRYVGVICRGTLTRFRKTSGYGFIKYVEGGQQREIFLHSSDHRRILDKEALEWSGRPHGDRDPQNGQQIVFEIGFDSIRKKPRAVPWEYAAEFDEVLRARIARRS